LLSRLHRKAEALDAACLRAWGHPHDHAIRQELLSALEWDSSFQPDHARPIIRHLFAEVHGHSVALVTDIQSNGDNLESLGHRLVDGVQGLRRSLGALVEALEARRVELGNGKK
jgi:hypothetical protein